MVARGQSFNRYGLEGIVGEKQLHRSPRGPDLVVLMPVSRRSDLIHGSGLLDRHRYPFLLFLHRKRICGGSAVS